MALIGVGPEHFLPEQNLGVWHVYRYKLGIHTICKSVL